MAEIDPPPTTAPPPAQAIPGPLANALTAAGFVRGGLPIPADYAAALAEYQARYARDAEVVERQRQEAYARIGRGYYPDAVPQPPPRQDRITEAQRAMEALGLIPPGGFAQTPDPIATKRYQVAEDRAYGLLAAEIGDVAAARIKLGGAYPIPSTLWPGVIYLIPRDGKVRILDRGRVIGESCLVLMEEMPWPDKVLAKIKRIRDDETIIFSIGIVNT